MNGGTRTTLRVPSQCDRIYAVLQDGRPHPMEDIHRQVGFCRLNSRIAELRARGHNIVCDKTGGLYVYRLLDAQPGPNGLLSGCASSGGTATSPASFLLREAVATGGTPPAAHQLTVFDALAAA